MKRTTKPNKIKKLKVTKKKPKKVNLRNKNIKGKYKKLTPKQMAFAKLIIENRDPTKTNKLTQSECYSKVYNAKDKHTASCNAYDTLQKPNVKYYIEQQEKKLHDKVLKMQSITIAEVIEGLKRIAMFDERKLYNEDGTLKHVKDLDDDTALALNSIKYGNYKLKKIIRKGKGAKAVTIKKETIHQYITELKGEARRPALRDLGDYLQMFDKDRQDETAQDFVTGVREFADDIAGAVPGGEL